jgi:hypothetical protein
MKVYFAERRIKMTECDVYEMEFLIGQFKLKSCFFIFFFDVRKLWCEEEWLRMMDESYNNK